MAARHAARGATAWRSRRFAGCRDEKIPAPTHSRAPAARPKWLKRPFPLTSLHLRGGGEAGRGSEGLCRWGAQEEGEEEGAEPGSGSALLGMGGRGGVEGGRYRGGSGQQRG